MTSRAISFAAGFGVVSMLLTEGAAAETPTRTVATFTGGEITLDDLESVISHKLPSEQAKVARDGAGSLLETLIRYDLLVREAEARGYAAHINVRDAVKRKAAELMMAERAGVAPDKIPAEQVAAAREAHQREYARPHMRRASQIVVATRPEAVALIARAKRTTREQFSHLATELSIDNTTNHQGGEFGYFTRAGETDGGQPVAIDPQLTAAAFALAKVGDVSPQPIAVKDGFSVLMLTAIMPAFAMPAGEIEERVRGQLADEQSKTNAARLEQALHDEYKPVVHPELADAIVISSEVESSGIPEGFPAAPPDPRQPPKLIEPDGF